MLTKREKVCFDTIKKYINENKVSPTVREICELMNYTSTSTAHRLVKNIEEKGYIEKKLRSPRSIVIIKDT